MSVSSPRNTNRRFRALLMIAVLLVAGIGAATPTQAGHGFQAIADPVGPAQIGGRAYIPLVGDVPQGQPNATSWLRPSATQINQGSYFSLTVLTKTNGLAPEPFVNVFVTYNTGLVDFQTAATLPGDYVTTQFNGFTVRFNGPIAPGQERYATIVFKARTNINNRDVQFAGNFDAAANQSGALPKVTVQIGTGGIPPIARYACEFGRGGSGPLGQYPGAGNNPFGTIYAFGALRRDNGGCGFTFSPGARVSYWVAQPTGPSVPLNIFGTADTYGEVEIRYTTSPLAQVCPVNLCAFAMNASSDNSYVLVAPFNLVRPGGTQTPDALPAAQPEAAGPSGDLVNPAQTARGGLSGVVTGSDGSLLGGVLVVVVDPLTDQVVRTAVTDASGQYVMPTGIPSGTFQVQFLTSLGHNPANAEYVDESVPVTTVDSAVTALNATLDPGGTISGRVTADNSAGLQEVLVLIYDATLSTVVSATVTDSTGTYTSDALASGNYIVQFEPLASTFDPSTGYVGEYHNNQPLGVPPVPVTVAAPSALSGVNGTLSRCPTCGAIDGRVTTQDGGAPLSHVTVVIRNAANGQQVTVENTDENGRYHVVLPSGSYTVEFFTDVSPAETTRAYADGFVGPNAIAVTAPAVTANINGVLTRGGQLAGIVTAKDGGAPLPDVFVVVTNAQQQVATTTFTDATGRFTTPALPNGSYTVTFQTAQSQSELTRGYKEGSRTAVVAGPGAKTGGADIQLGR